MTRPILGRVSVAAVLTAATVTATAGPAGAHGVGSRADLPVPVWLFAYSAAFALLISFAALRLLWPRPRLTTASAGVAAPDWAAAGARVGRTVFQAVALVLFVASVYAGWFGVDNVTLNLAPTALYIAFWVGMSLVSAVLGDVWRHANPLWTIAAAIDRLRGRDPETSTATGWWASRWPAAVGLGVFLWLELAYFEPGDPRNVAVFLTAYSAFVLGGAVAFGAGWVRNGDGFAVLFSLLAALSPLSRDTSGGLRVRWPGSGVAGVVARGGTLGVIVVVLGGTTFDGVTRTRTWDGIVGARRAWERTQVLTVGLALTIAVVAAVYLGAIALLARLADDDTETEVLADRWAPSLIPIVLAYAIAHYYSLLRFEGQNFVALLSDPLGSGWDLFGTADHNIDFTVVSPEHIAYVQVGAIVVGHVLGVVTAHDRAVESYDHARAVRSQYPLLGVMIAYTVSGLLLLLNA